MGALALALTLALTHSGPARADDDPREALFEAYREALESGNKAAAADALVAVTRDGEAEEHHDEAWHELAGLLAALDLRYAALVASRQSLDTYSAPDDEDGPPARAGGRAGDEDEDEPAMEPPPTLQAVITRALDLADAVGDEAILEPALAVAMGEDAEEMVGEIGGRVAWLAARGAFTAGDLGDALSHLEGVPGEHPLYPRAQHLRGVILSQQAAYNSAFAPLLTASALLEQAGESELLEVVNQNLGRTYYAAGNFPAAAGYFEKIPRESPLWLETQFELAWTTFRMQDMNKTLALLQTHRAPFFTEYYYPEAQILRIYALFLLCKFPDATAQIDTFQATYGPVRDALGASLAAMDASAIFADARAWADGDDASLPAMFLRDWAGQEGFRDTAAAVAAAEEELGRLKSAGAHAFSGVMRELLTAHRDALVDDEGARIQARVEAQLSEITTWMDDTDFLKLDMLKLETRMYEQASRTGQLEEAREVARRRFRRRPAEMVWAFQGEYWGDELGFYRIETPPDCPASMRSGE